MYAKYTALRDAREVTDSEVARQTGIATSTLTDWKMGRYTPKVDKIKKLADYFGVTIEYFLEEDKE